ALPGRGRDPLRPRRDHGRGKHRRARCAAEADRRSAGARIHQACPAAEGQPRRCLPRSHRPRAARDMRQTARLFSLLLRAYLRDRIALFFSLVVPLMLMVIFGYLNLGDFGRVSLAVDDQAKNDASKQLLSLLKGIETLQITEESTDEALKRLRRTELDVLVVIPKDFAIAPARPGQTVPQLVVYGDDARPQQVVVGRQIIARVIDRLSFAVTQTAPVVAVKDETVQGVRLRYVDFLV